MKRKYQEVEMEDSELLPFQKKKNTWMSYLKTFGQSDGECGDWYIFF